MACVGGEPAASRLPGGGKTTVTVAVFLDRDGVIIENRRDYVKSWAEVEILPGALQALSQLAALPVKVVLVTNQSPVGRGIITAGQVGALNARLAWQIESGGGRLDAMYVCPHAPDEGCDCRKPRPGLLLRAARELGLELEECYLVGDAASDIEAALAAGTRAILVRTGRGGEHAGEVQHRWPAVPVLDDLGEAVKWIEGHVVGAAQSPHEYREPERLPEGDTRAGS